MKSYGSSLSLIGACHEYCTVIFEEGTLGLTLVPLDTSQHPILGNCIVGEIEQGGQASKKDIKPFDAIVAVNGKYMAFNHFEMIESELRNSYRPLEVTIARVKRDSWARIGKESDAVVKMGKLEKYTGSYLTRWQHREFTLTRSTLSYMDANGGYSKLKIGLEEIVQIIPAPLTLGSEAEFSLSFQGKEMRIRCTKMNAIEWMHAIETTKKGCFDNAFHILSLIEKQFSAPKSKPQTTTSVPPAAARPAPKPPIQQGPYHLLRRSMVMIKCDLSFDDDIDVSLPPPPVVRNFQPIDLSLERKLIGV